MINFLLFVVTNLCSLILLCFPRYQTKKKRNGKTRSFEVLDLDNYNNIPQSPQPKEVVSTPSPTHEITPPTERCDSALSHGFRFGIHPPPIEANAYEIKTSLLRLIQSSKFLGNGIENPYDHLDYFERLCTTFKIAGVPQDSIKLILFPFSLGDKATKWEKAIPSHLVRSWDDCKRVFLQKFYPTQRTHQIRRSILSFKQGVHETFYEAWERLRGYTRDCPHHGFTREAILASFYWGVSKEYQWTLDVASKGSFLNLTMEEGELLVENLAMSDERSNESYDTTPNEESSAYFKWKELHAKVDKPLSVKSRGNHLVYEKHQEEANFVVNNGESNKWNMPLNHGSNHDLQGFQQSYQVNHENSQVSKHVDVEVTEDRTTLCFSTHLGDLQHQEEVHHVGTALHSGLDSTQWVIEDKSALEMFKGDAFSLNGECNTAFFFSPLEVEESMINGGNKELASIPTACKRKKVCSEEKALAYDAEDFLSLDGACLETFFSFTMEELGNKKEVCGRAKIVKTLQSEFTELEGDHLHFEGDHLHFEGDRLHFEGDSLIGLFTEHTEGAQKGEVCDPFEATLAQKKKKKAKEPPYPPCNPSPLTLSLVPLKFQDGKIEYKIKCKGKTKPFASAKAIVPTKLQEDSSKLQEYLSQALTITLESQPHFNPP